MHSPAEGVGAQCKLWFNLLILQLFCVSQQAKQASPKIQNLSFVFVFLKMLSFKLRV